MCNGACNGACNGRAMGVQWACNGRAMYTRCYIMIKTIDQSFGWPEPLVCQSASLAWCFAANNTCSAHS